MNGVQAAKAAGMSVVAVPHPQNDKSEFEAEADLVLNSLADFDPSIYGIYL